ncbi:hypothetical protein [Roseateles paludis]|jgi:hypothetical protein|uniref:Uncharacterized protein n=1 Tax=Roseateles paludis TaxID=3145238 RepID=A0ABV0FX73_9BURK
MPAASSLLSKSLQEKLRVGRLRTGRVVFALVVAALLAVMLAWVSLSKAHRDARAAINESPIVARKLGAVRMAIPIGFRYVNRGSSCAVCTYWVFGSDHSAIVKVGLSMPQWQPAWTVDAVIVGLHGASSLKC